MPGWISYDGAGNRVQWRAPTEDSVACRLAEAQAGRLRFCHAARAWFAWDGALWRRDAGAAAEAARSLAREMGREPDGRPVMAAGGPASSPACCAWRKTIRPSPFRARDWDADPCEAAGSWRELAEALKSRGFTCDRTKTERLYRGLALRAVTGDS